jgi:hypothetical protein
MANIELHTDLDALLKDPGIASVINGLAQSVAVNARYTTSDGETLPVVVDQYTTDRRAASVTIAHPAGLAVQAKHGVLTRAASAAGLEVRAK